MEASSSDKKHVEWELWMVRYEEAASATINPAQDLLPTKLQTLQEGQQIQRQALT
jgi:hypothetical protein